MMHATSSGASMPSGREPRPAWPRNPDGTPAAARHVPLDELEEPLRSLITALPEIVAAQVRLREARKRGLCGHPAVATVTLPRIIKTLTYLTKGQAAFLRWLASEPGLQATYAEIGKWRRRLDYTPTLRDWDTERRFCYRLAIRLVDENANIRQHARPAGTARHRGRGRRRSCPVPGGLAAGAVIRTPGGWCQAGVIVLQRGRKRVVRCLYTTHALPL